MNDILCLTSDEDIQLLCALAVAFFDYSDSFHTKMPIGGSVSTYEARTAFSTILVEEYNVVM